MKPTLQLDAQGRLRHLLTLEGLPRELLLNILDEAEAHDRVLRSADKKQPALAGRSIINLFFEPSTRTRTTFDMAATRLSGDVPNREVADPSTSQGQEMLHTPQTTDRKNQKGHG